MPMTKTLGDQDCLVNLNVALVINSKNLVVDRAKLCGVYSGESYVRWYMATTPPSCLCPCGRSARSNATSFSVNGSIRTGGGGYF